MARGEQRETAAQHIMYMTAFSTKTKSKDIEYICRWKNRFRCMAAVVEVCAATSGIVQSCTFFAQL
jgi:hypothetical protein